MVYLIVGATFEPVRHGGLNDEHPTFVHTHLAGPVAPSLVLFVHGLNGSRYRTWGDFPRFLFDADQSIDIGLYDYASGLRRYPRLDMVELPVQAQLVADQIRTLPYANVVLVGHSMGGLLCMGAIRRLVDAHVCDADGVRVATRVAGLFLFATPRAGSLRMRWPFTRTVDGRVLRTHSGYLTELNNMFANRISMDGARSVGPGMLAIPTYAAIATRDRWVDRLSAGLGMPDSHTLTVRGTHTSIVKPSSPQNDLFGWFREKLDECLVAARARTADSKQRIPDPRDGSHRSPAFPGGSRPMMTVNTGPDLLGEVVEMLAGLRFDEQIALGINVLPREGE
jgi:pimeloyl-ACP methyl ester carboxylesterase